MEKKDFENKKILIIVPHEDDEICVTGGLLASLPQKCEKYIIYVTNGNYIYKTQTRYKEAIKSCNILGVKKNNIYFLGYSDQPYDQDTHIYNNLSSTWQDKYGNFQTSGTKKIKEYCYSKFKEHHKFTKENIISDIKNCISDIMPDMIFCVDLDFHPDHIMTSLCFENAMGKILKEKKDYFPMVFKGFAYENAYLGPKDFNQKKVEKMKFEYDKEGNLINNPYYSKNNEIEIQLEEESYTRNLFKNKLYKAIKQHRSQVLVERAFSIINPNAIYWKRETNNLINRAEVRVSSGNKNYLNDFLINDSSYILNGNKKKINYNESIWIPDKTDKEKKIEIFFDKKIYIYKMKIYNGNNGESLSNKIKIIFNDNEEKIVENNKLILELAIDNKINKISIQILDNNSKNGFSEIEILGKKEDFGNSSEKILKENEKFNIYLNEILNKIDIFFTKCYRKCFIHKRKN